MKKSEVNNKHRNKYGKIKTILSIFSFKHNIFPDVILMKHRSRLCAHRGMQKWVVQYWWTCDPVVNRISMRSLLDIASIHELSRISIDFVLAFTQSDVDVYVFMDITLGMGVDGNRKQWVLNLNK